MNKREFIKTSVYATAAGITVPSIILSSCSSGKKQEETSGEQGIAAAAATGFTLPDLPYDAGALQPAIDQRTMEIHHGKHHNGYVNKLNKALENVSTKYSSVEEVLTNVSKMDVAVRNNAGGHYNHSLFWKILSPGKTEVPAALGDKIVSRFGSFESFSEEFKSAGLSVFGSGWVWLCVADNNDLFITTSPNQDNPLMDFFEERGTPVLGIDVWEHAYYLKYQNRRGDYLNSVFEIINWEQVDANLAESIS